MKRENIKKAVNAEKALAEEERRLRVLEAALTPVSTICVTVNSKPGTASFYLVTENNAAGAEIVVALLRGHVCRRIKHHSEEIAGLE